MRTYGTLRTPDTIPQPPDTVQTFLLAAGTAQALDWPNSTGGAAANADANECQIARFTFCTTAGAPMLGMVNLNSTLANAPSSGTSATTGTTVGSTGNAIPVLGQGSYGLPSYSTGYSVASPSSGNCIVEIWKR